MTSKEFTTWLKGFVAASHHYNLTPDAFNTLKVELEKVDDDVTILRNFVTGTVTGYPGSTTTTYTTSSPK